MTHGSRLLLILLLCAAAGLHSGPARLRAAEPSARYAVHLDATEATTATTAQAPISVLLESLERRVVALETGTAGTGSLAELEAEASEVIARAPTANERIRARRLLNRARQANDAPRGGVVRASYEELPSPAASRLVDPPADGPRLERLAQLAARLAQYGAPPGIDPALEPVPMMAVAVAPPPTRHYISLDTLGWWVRGDRLPPLVTTSPVGTPQAIAGVLDEPTTSILYGNQRVNTGIRWGGRVQGGVWLDDFQTFALEGHYYGLASVDDGFSRTSTFGGGSLNDAILARPFFDADPLVNANSSILVAFPDYVLGPDTFDIDGAIRVSETSRIQSAGGGARYAIGTYNAPLRLFLLGGYRFFDLNESLKIKAASSLGFDPFPFPDDAGYIEAVDSFATRNIFNGGELGLGTELQRSRWSLGAETRLALGNMNQQLVIDGRTSAIYETYVASFAGGLLAMPTNIGTYERNRIALIPQFDLKVGYQLFPCLRLMLGYNFTYVSSVLRPGDQVDLNVNTTQVAGLPLIGPAVPAASLNATSIWLQGITMGVDMRF